MNLKLFNRKAIWLSTLGLVVLMGGACYSQQESRRDDDFFMHQTLAKISLDYNQNFGAFIARKVSKMN